MPGTKDLPDADLIIEDLQAADNTAVIREFASFLKNRGKVRDKDALFDIVLQRESSTTGIGDGIAIPHVRMQGLPRVIVAFGRSRKGMDFQSMDGKPAHLFFTPEDRPTYHRERQKLNLDEDENYPNCR